MMNRHFSLLLCILIFAGTQILAQDGPSPQKDSITFVSKDSLIFLDSTLIMPTKADTLKKGPSLEDLIYKGRNYSLEANQIMLELQDDLDTTRFAEEIPTMERTINLINERVKHEDSEFNFRYVTH